MPSIPRTELMVSDLCLGANVFGWTADEATSYAILDRYVDATPSTLAPFVDTAESYGDGTSERILGGWMADRGVRDRIVVATKASRGQKEHPLSAGEIRMRGHSATSMPIRLGGACSGPRSVVLRAAARPLLCECGAALRVLARPLLHKPAVTDR